jgi:hypothetical protein
LKTKIPALLGCSADIYLHFKTFPSFLTFKMAEKSLTHSQIKRKKTVSRKTQNNFFLWLSCFFPKTWRDAQITSIIEILKKKFYVGCFSKTAENPSKTIIKPINYSAFESRDDELSKYV